MKRGAPEHPKMRAFARTLGVPHYAAVGLLELLWHFTAKYAPQGDVGRFDNAAIAEAVGYGGDPDALVSALLCTGWVDACATNRILVHGWAEHADQGVKNTLKSRGLEVLRPTIVQPRSNPSRTRVRRQSDERKGTGTGLGTGSGSCGERGESEGRGGSPPDRLDGFDEFYRAYPRREKRKPAAAAWVQVAERRPPLPELLAIVAAQVASNFAGRERRHIPLPETWLRQERWTDDIAPPSAAGGAHGRGTSIRTGSSEDADKWEREAAARDACRARERLRAVGGHPG